MSWRSRWRKTYRQYVSGWNEKQGFLQAIAPQNEPLLELLCKRRTRTFTIGGDDFNDDLLIISTDSIPIVPGRTQAVPFEEDDIVQVTGRARSLISGNLKEYNIDVDPEVMQEFGEDPMVVARSEASVANPVVEPTAPVLPPLPLHLLRTHSDVIMSGASRCKRSYGSQGSTASQLREK